MSATALTKSVTFEAAHRLPKHMGMCRRLHGHSYRLTVHCRAHALEKDGPSEGMIIDTQDVAEIVRVRVLAKVDHRYLNRVPGLEVPTTEIVARWIYEQLKGAVPHLHHVDLAEGFTSTASYPGDIT